MTEISKISFDKKVADESDRLSKVAGCGRIHPKSALSLAFGRQ